MTAKEAVRVTQREFEALVGGALLKTVGKAAENVALKKSKLVAKSAYLPLCGYTMYYHEREAVAVDGKVVDKKDQPTILFFHGISQKSEDFAMFVASLKIPPHIRVIAPEQMGHGRDIERARVDPDNYVQPTHESMLKTTSEFLDVVEVGSNTNAFGVSLGGAVCYYLAHHRPDIIKRSVLVSPAILPCVDKGLVNGIQDGTNNFICFESREDVKLLLRDLSTGRDDTDRKKKDPVPKFFLETVYRTSPQSRAPEGHYRAMLLSLLTNAGSTSGGTPECEPGNDDDRNSAGNVANPFLAATDVDADAHRLVIWPEKDQIINYEQGKQFFEVSTTQEGKLMSTSRNTEFESIQNCGHVFDANGKSIMDIIRPRVREYLLNFTKTV